MREDFSIGMVLIGILILVAAVSHRVGSVKGYDRALADVKLLTPPPQTTDQQCVAWLFETNMKDVKRKICR